MTIFPILHLAGFFANIICAKIFSTSSKIYKTNTFKLLTLNSIVSCLFLLLYSVTPLTQCVVLCKSWHNGYFIKFYKKYADAYLCKLLDMMCTFLNVAIVVDRYLCLKNIKLKWQKFTMPLLIAIFGTVSVILFLPNLFYCKVIKTESGNSTFIYEIQQRNFTENSRIIKKTSIATQSTISILSILIVAIVNILLIKKLYDQLTGINRKIIKFKMVKKGDTQNLQFSSIKCKKVNSIEKQTTILVAIISFIFLINQIVLQIINFAPIFVQVNSIKYNFIFIAYNMCAFLYHGTNIFFF